MIDAIIFDFDGVILDTETPNYTTWQEVFESYGVSLDHNYWSEFIGGGTHTLDVCKHLTEISNKSIDCELLKRERREKYVSLVESSPLLPGVWECITNANNHGLKLAIASSSSSAWIEEHLDKRGLTKYFECIKTRDDVRKVKPDPEIYRSAIKCLSVSPDQAVVIEDSPNGITAAKKAGLCCIVIPNEMTKQLPINHADYNFESIAKINIPSLFPWLD